MASRDVPPAPSSERCPSRSGRTAPRRAFPFTAAPPSRSCRTSPGAVSWPSPWRPGSGSCATTVPLAVLSHGVFPFALPSHAGILSRDVLPLTSPSRGVFSFADRRLPLRWPVTRGVPRRRHVALCQPHRHATLRRRAAGGRARRNQGVKKRPAGARGTRTVNRRQGGGGKHASRAGATVRRYPCIDDIHGGAGEQAGPGRR